MVDLLPEEAMIRIPAECKRVLQPGGTLVPVNMTGSETFAGRLYQSPCRLSPRPLGGCRGVLQAEKLVR